ncbi:MAG: hypothetical protein EXR92_07545 [Gemmatimonadetes bacterium]|nr:hypothetical protein [Gemmatimonadota bacterium]
MTTLSFANRGSVGPVQHRRAPDRRVVGRAGLLLTAAAAWPLVAGALSAQTVSSLLSSSATAPSHSVQAGGMPLESLLAHRPAEGPFLE